MLQPTVITIDGPAGSGKSTVGALLAQHLGYVYFDTGVTYRALTLVALQQHLDMHDVPALTALAQEIRITVSTPTHDDGRQSTIFANDHDVTWDIRSLEVDRNVSLLSRIAAVRSALVRQHREIGQQGNIVMVGRDIGTSVMPDAPLKIYLQASLDIRARRRVAEQQQQGRNTTLEQVRADMARRDELDHHVLHPAPDAHILHTDTCSPAEVVAWIIRHFAPATRSPVPQR